MILKIEQNKQSRSTWDLANCRNYGFLPCFVLAQSPAQGPSGIPTLYLLIIAIGIVIMCPVSFIYYAKTKKIFWAIIGALCIAVFLIGIAAGISMYIRH